MKKYVTLVLVLVFGGVIFMSAGAQQDKPVQSLRGNTPLNEEPRTAAMAQWQRDRDPIPRDYLQQPPLIPHKITSYRITTQNNKCLSCHSWAKYKEVGATKISLTHFKDSAGRELANVAPRRYFCTQCHVPQTDAKPLVENTFRPIEAISQE